MQTSPRTEKIRTTQNIQNKKIVPNLRTPLQEPEKTLSLRLNQTTTMGYETTATLMERCIAHANKVTIEHQIYTTPITIKLQEQ